MENNEITTQIIEAAITELPEKIYNVEEKQQIKLHVSGEDKRKLLMLMADWEARYKDYMEEGRSEEYFAQYGRYQAMYKGVVPVETLPVIKFVPLNEKRIEEKEPLMIADFYTTHPNTRLVKNTLAKALHLVHNPNAQTNPPTGRPDYLTGHFGARRFKVWEVTNEAASRVFEMYKEPLQLYFLDTYFWKDRTTASGPKAETTLPESKAQIEARESSIDSLLS